MTRSLKIAGLTLGDPFSQTSRSGVNYNVFSRLSSGNCELVKVFDLDVRGLSKVLLAASNFSIDRKRWGNKLHQNPWAFEIRTRMAARRLGTIKNKYNMIFQDGAMFMPGDNLDVPLATYHDSNVLLSASGGTAAHGAHYKGSKLDKTIAQEKRLYERAAVIFTMSDWLKQSMIRDFGISDEKIVTVYAGTNLEFTDFNKIYDGKTILFIGKNFRRKGGYALLEAFRKVKKEIPEARLVIVGPEIDIQQDGVVVKGLVTDKEELQKLFMAASVFVLPSLFEPFGIVFAEAFAYKNPCIGTDICAMPEIIENGKGGFVVPPGDANTLADRIIQILSDHDLAKEMGHFGFEKARRIFNWDAVVGTMRDHCSTIV